MSGINYRLLAAFEALLIAESSHQVLSNIYNLLITSKMLVNTAEVQWKRDLKQGISWDDWLEINCINGKFPRSVGIKEK